MKNKLKEVLKNKGMTAYRLAQLTGIGAPHIYNIISGKEYPYPSWRNRIADALQLPEESIFSEEERGDILCD